MKKILLTVIAVVTLSSCSPFIAPAHIDGIIHTDATGGQKIEAVYSCDAHACVVID